MSQSTQKVGAQCLCVLLAAVLMVAIAALIIGSAMVDSTSDRIYLPPESIGEEKFDCVLVLGAGLKSDGTPSHMLEDRLIVGINALETLGAKCILMSGDRSSDNYDEPAAMKKYAEELGVDPSLIIVDNEGYSTYESIVRAKEIYGFDKIVVVTQEYHLHRALYIADKNGIYAVGADAALRPYSGQIMRDIREVLARVKDFFACK